MDVLLIKEQLHVVTTVLKEKNSELHTIKSYINLKCLK